MLIKMSDNEEVKRKRGRPVSVTDSAKKRRKKELDKKRGSCRINIGEAIHRWRSLMSELNMNSAELAAFLIDRYEIGKEKLPNVAAAAATSAPFVSHIGATKSPASSRISSADQSIQGRYEIGKEKLPNVAAAATSTPFLSHLGATKSPALSRISSADESMEGRESDMSGMEAIHSDSSENTGKHDKVNFKSQLKYPSTSFMDPFEISIEISEAEGGDSSDNSDEDYEPSVNITIGPSHTENIEPVTFEESEFGIQVEEGAGEQEDTSDSIPGLLRIKSPDEQHILSDDQVYLVYQQPLFNLAKLTVGSTCTFHGCSEAVDLVPETVGSALYIKWVCKSGHIVNKWCSQPILNRRLHGGDLMLSAAILLSGNNFSKVALFARFLKLQFVSSTVFLRIQRVYLVPCIDSFWEETRDALLAGLRDEPIVVLGDGRMDSPGHCAQYCTYTFMDNDTKKIVSIITLDKREAGGKSGNLEKLGFIKSMTILGEKEVSVGEVVTDAHMQISALMKKDFPAVKHSYDIWHAAKNIGKKIVKAGQDKECKALLPWSQHIVNHFWHTSEKATTYEDFIGIWFGVLHHVTNEHEWIFSYGKGTSSCSHGPLTDEREIEWLKKGHSSHTALRKVVMDKRLLNNVPYFLNSRSTAELENFHNHILMYASKRFAYTPPVYRARNQLAALDYNEHVGRQCQLNKDGSKRYQRLFNKKSSRWTVIEQKEPKQYGHIPGLISKILTTRLEDRVGMQGPAFLENDDPRRTSRNIAPVPPPPTRDLVEQKKSRLKKD